MIGRSVGAAAIAAVLLFLVGFLWWGLPVGPGSLAMHQAPREAELQDALREHLPASGTYAVPMMSKDGEQEVFFERHRKGPVALILFHREGEEPMDPKVMVLGFLHGLVTSLLAAAVVRGVAVDRSFAVRWCVVFALGLFVVVWENASGLIWWSAPLAWVAAQSGYNLVGWALAGLPIAALVRRPGAASAS